MSSIVELFTGALNAYAATPTLGYFTSFVGEIGKVVKAAVPVLVALALALFIWGMVKFIFAGGDEKAMETGKSHMIWGIIALFIIVTVWGLVALLVQLTGVNSAAAPSTPFTNFV